MTEQENVTDEKQASDDLTAADVMTDDGASDEADASDPNGESDDATGSDAADGSTDGGPVRVLPRRWIAGCAVLVVAIIAACVWGVLSGQDRSNAEARTAEQSTVEKAAATGAARILSYKPQTVDQDLAGAKTLLTGSFLDYFNQFTSQVVAPSSKQKQIATTATVPAAGVSSINGDDAVVLVMVNQETTSLDNPQPAQSASTVRVEMTKKDGKWLISKFDPV